jgi:hypothetical protein
LIQTLTEIIAPYLGSFVGLVTCREDEKLILGFGLETLRKGDCLAGLGINERR